MIPIGPLHGRLNRIDGGTGNRIILTIFSCVRRSLYCFLALGFLVAFVNAGFAFMGKTPPFLPEPARAWAISSFHRPPTELDVHSVQRDQAACGNHGLQKASGDFTSGYNKASGYQCSESCSNGACKYSWTKDYLSHIYPSHHFW